ncbi:winged helix-turn-helix domain-containing protein [Marivirga sp.]|uniref:winged helix-turn-helix domain-containing protein n=1 Tax=Marivirga sp. TaxID=2018662 RepID=UPI003DA73594
MSVAISFYKIFMSSYMPLQNGQIRIFKDLDMVEQLGSGIPRILQVYPKDCFKISENFIRMSFPKEIGKTESSLGGGPISGLIELTDRQKEVLELIRQDSKLTKRALAEKLGINVSAAQAHIDNLKEKGMIIRQGGTRGKWVLTNKI